MEKQKPLYRYAGFTVWSNRVEYVVGWWVFKNVTTLPIRNIVIRQCTLTIVQDRCIISRKRI